MAKQAVAVVTNEEEEGGMEIRTKCVSCGKEGIVRGLNWGDLFQSVEGIEEMIDEAFGGEVAVINRTCANCRYRQTAAKKPMSDEQKQARAAYNKQRNERIKKALALLNEAESTDEDDDQ